MERFNGEINTKVNLPLKLVFVYMEHVLGILDRAMPLQLGAIQALGVWVLEQADVLLLGAWDVHIVRSSTRNIGEPRALRAARPHTGQQRQLTPGADYVVRYEVATGTVKRREPSWLPARDPLHGQPARQAARKAAVMQVWGTVGLAWTDVLHNTGRARFIPAYFVYLAFR